MTDTDDTVTGDQHRHMHALWRTAGVTDRDQRLALTSAAVGRQISTSNQLTRGEARHLIDYMLQLDAAGVLADKARDYLAALPDRMTAAS